MIWQFFCAKGVVSDYVARHPRDPRGYRELGKIYLFSCGGDETISKAEDALQRSAELSSPSRPLPSPVLRRLMNLLFHPSASCLSSSDHQDPETFFLLSACARTRLIGLARSSPHFADLFSSAERHLHLALLHSFNALPYRLALSDFYQATDHPALALTTLEDGLSTRAKARHGHGRTELGRPRRRERAPTIDSSVEGPPNLGPTTLADDGHSDPTNERDVAGPPDRGTDEGDDPADAPILEELGKFGMRVVPGLLSEGRTHEARKVCENALEYLTRALRASGGADGEQGDEVRREWEVELEEAERVYEDLNEGVSHHIRLFLQTHLLISRTWQTLFDFADEPDFSPRRPDAYVHDLHRGEFVSKPPETLLRRPPSHHLDANSSSSSSTSSRPRLAGDACPVQHANIDQAAQVPRAAGLETAQAGLEAASRCMVVSPTPSSDEAVPLPTRQMQSDAKAFAAWAHENKDPAVVVTRPAVVPPAVPRPLPEAPAPTALPLPPREPLSGIGRTSSSNRSGPRRRRASDQDVPPARPVMDPTPPALDIYDEHAITSSTLTDGEATVDPVISSTQPTTTGQPTVPPRTRDSRLPTQWLPSATLPVKRDASRTDPGAGSGT